MDEDARVCGQCGVPIEGGINSGVAGGGTQSGGAVNKKPWIKFVIALVVVLCIAGIVVKVVSNYTGRKGFIRKVVKAYVDYDIDGLMNLASDIYFYKEDVEKYGEMYFENTVGSTIDYFENSIGHNYKTSYEIIEIYELSKRKHDEFLKELEYEYPDFDIESIDTVYAAKVKITAKQDKRNVNKTIQMTMTKEGDNWKLLRFE